jgi:hypothetical protein
MIKDEVEYKTDLKKVNIFASLLSNTYSASDNENDFDKTHKLKVNKAVSDYKFKNNIFPFTTQNVQLGKIYLAKAVGNNEYVSLLLDEYIDSISSIKRKGKGTPLCLFYQES